MIVWQMDFAVHRRSTWAIVGNPATGDSSIRVLSRYFTVGDLIDEAIRSFGRKPDAIEMDRGWLIRADLVVALAERAIAVRFGAPLAAERALYDAIRANDALLPGVGGVK